MSFEGKEYQVIEDGIEYRVYESSIGETNWFRIKWLTKETPSGRKYATCDEEIHRVNGPAITYKDGSQCWVFEGKTHRNHGPAYENGDFKEWWIHGEHCSKEEYYWMKMLSEF